MTHPDELKPTKTLICACCGSYTRGRQWWNRDRGYGLCPDCATSIEKREGYEELRESYGIPTVHHSLLGDAWAQ